MAEFSVFKQVIGEREEVASYRIAVALNGFGEIDGNKLITPTCVSGFEWDAQLDRVIKRLEELRDEGKEFLR